MRVKAPNGYKPNNIPYKQVGSNKYVRKGAMPGSVLAGLIQVGKEIANEVFGQGVSKGVSEVYDKQNQQQSIEQ